VRGPDLPWRKAANEHRILFLGDSVTFGWDMHEQETLVSKCADIFRREYPSSRVRCINAGVPGYATWQQYDFLQDEGMAMEPDLVVLCFCFNDVTDLLFVNPDELSGPRQRFSFSNDPHWSGIVRAVRSVQARRRGRNLRDAQHWEAIDHTALREGQLTLVGDRFRRASRPALDKAWNRALRDLEKVDDACRQRALPWVLMALPFRSQFEPGDAGVLPQDKLQSWAQAQEVSYLDLLPAIEGRVSTSEDALDELYQDDLHFTETGNRFVASELVEFLAGQRLLPASARREPEAPDPP
jgi:lysophospholipase L1-like esterase